MRVEMSNGSTRYVPRRVGGCASDCQIYIQNGRNEKKVEKSVYCIILLLLQRDILLYTII